MHRLGRSLEIRQSWQEALRWYEAVRSVTSRRDQPRSYGVVLHDEADVYVGLERYSKAVRFYRTALRYKKAARSEPIDLVRTYLALGAALERAGDFPRAVEAYAEALVVLPGDAAGTVEGARLQAAISRNSALATGITP
jgi:tetratricopeptide (TPR) repeat protein